MALTKDTQRGICEGKPIPRATPPTARQQSIVGDKTRALWSGSRLRGKPQNSCESGEKLYLVPAGTQHNAAFMLLPAASLAAAPASSATPQLHGPASASEAARSGPPPP